MDPSSRRPAGGHAPVLPRRPQPLPDPAQAGKELVAALDAFAAGTDHQVLCASSSASRPTSASWPSARPGPPRGAGQGAAGGRPAEPAYSFLSLTEVSEYMETEDDVRARLQAQGTEDIEDRVAKALERLAGQREDRLHPRLPRKAVLAFYPMSKARDPDANWYRLPFDRRRELMHGHGKVGRRYTGRVLQLVTGSTGLDDFEWGVTLLADDLSAIKEVVYDMRFDEVTASYGRFGPFLVGLTCDPSELPERLGLR